MAPFKSSLARSVGKLLGVQTDNDLDLRGEGQSSRVPPDPIITGPFTISGGTVLTPGNGNKYHVFTSPGNLTLAAGPGCSGTVNMFIIAGGGGGGIINPAGEGYGGLAGGGGGGIVYATSYDLYGTYGTPKSYPVVVGSGGGPGAAGSAGVQGGTSSIDLLLVGAPSGAAIPISAVGGGGGAGESSGGTGGAGGNGGGGVQSNVGGTLTAPPNSPIYPLAPGTITVYGNPGHTDTSIYGSGGGGSGAGGLGEKPSADGVNYGGDGGAGLAVPSYPGPLIAPATPNPGVFGPIVGPTGLYAGGGGGACYRNGYGDDGDAGPGGGGYGGTGRSASGTPLGKDGVPATGGGGGGGAGQPAGGSGGTGGPGIVIVSYPIE
jgi:hypothetical protein